MVLSSMLHVRLDDETRTQGNAVLDAIGLSASDAVRLLYKRIAADQSFPIELKVPNARTREAMTEAHAILRNRRARFASASDAIAELEAPGGD